MRRHLGECGRYSPLGAGHFFGIATANKMPDKFARSRLHAVKSARVDAPVVEEFPITLGCKAAEIQQDKEGFRMLGEIVNVLADEAVLGEKGRVTPENLNAFAIVPCGYPAEERKQQDRYEESRVHYIR